MRNGQDCGYKLRLVEEIQDVVERDHELLSPVKGVHLLRSESSGNVHQSFELSATITEVVCDVGGCATELRRL